jgi:hypothetical protein
MEFYARFLVLYVSKMKRDWIKKDEEFNGKGPKKYKGECWTKRLLKIEADNIRAIRLFRSCEHQLQVHA